MSWFLPSFRMNVPVGRWVELLKKCCKSGFMDGWCNILAKRETFPLITIGQYISLFIRY